MADIQISHADKYSVLTIDLGTAHTDALVEVAGRSFSLLFTDGTGLIKFDRQSAAAIPLERISTLEWPEDRFEQFFLTNTAQYGATAIVLISAGPAFRVNPAMLGLVDVTDRPERSIGTISAVEEAEGGAQPLSLSQPRGVLVTPMPWSAHYPWGRVIMHDDFESTLKWKQTAGTVTRANDAEFVHGDLYSMKMVTGAVAGNGAAASIWRQPPRSDSMYAVLELHFALSAAADATPRDFYLAWNIQNQNLAHGHQFGLRLLHHSAGAFQRQLQYRNAAGAWADIVGVTYKVPVTTAMWHYLVIVLKYNVATGWQYYWGRMNDVEFMMSTLACQAVAYVSPYQEVILECMTDADFATTAYVDDLTLLDMVQEHIA